MAKAVAVFLISYLVASPAAAYYVWPWQQHARHRHHHRPAPDVPDAPPDCAKINAAVKTLSPQRYERAIGLATPAERKIIADCAVQP